MARCSAPWLQLSNRQGLRMKDTIKHRIDKLSDAVNDWLSPENQKLKAAIDRTVKDGLFSFEDVKYQLLALKRSLKKEAFYRWADKADIDSQKNQFPKKVLCLHAGNLPLVGVQDILAVVLAGHSYLGKLSRKDPYLPASLLMLLSKRGIIDGRWSDTLDELKNEGKADALMFSGSTESVEPVLDKLNGLGLADKTTPRLVRTAHYSMALIEDDKPDTFKQLADAVLRYGGSGCRSVALVVAPFGLNSKKCEFTDYVESFWLKNPQHKKPAPSLYHRFAYNRSVGIEQSWLDDFMIEETDHQPTEPFILHWVKGGPDRFNELALKYQDGLQALYVMDPDTKVADGLPAPEMLSDAQQPPIWWTPDGQDPLEWLTTI